MTPRLSLCVRKKRALLFFPVGPSIFFFSKRLLSPHLKRRANISSFIVQFVVRARMSFWLLREKARNTKIKGQWQPSFEIRGLPGNDEENRRRCVRHTLRFSKGCLDHATHAAHFFARKKEMSVAK